MVTELLSKEDWIKRQMANSIMTDPDSAFSDIFDAKLPDCWLDLTEETEFHSGARWGWAGWVQTPRRFRFNLGRDVVWC